LFIIGAVVVLLLVVVVAGGGGGYLSGAAGAGCASPGAMQGVVVTTGDGVNLRGGPAATYAIVIGLKRCSMFDIKGRNSDASWLEVESNVGGSLLRGWVANGSDNYGNKWLNLNLTDIGAVPLSTATYGQQVPASGGSAGGGYGGPIGDNYFEIGGGYVSSGKITGLSASQPYNVTLAPADAPKKAVVIWQGTTNNDGSTGFQAPFPYTWADGSQIKSGNLTLVIYVNGAAQRTTQLAYSTK
jgi:hypothetical protein